VRQACACWRRSHVALGVNYGNEPTLRLNDKDGWPRAALVLTSTNTVPILKFLDPRSSS